MVFGAFLSLLPLPEKFRKGGLAQIGLFQGGLSGHLKTVGRQRPVPVLPGAVFSKESKGGGSHTVYIGALIDVLAGEKRCV